MKMIRGVIGGPPQKPIKKKKPNIIEKCIEDSFELIKIENKEDIIEPKLPKIPEAL